MKIICVCHADNCHHSLILRN